MNGNREAGRRCNMKRFAMFVSVACALLALSPAAFGLLPPPIVSDLLHVEEETVPNLGVLVFVPIPLAVLICVVLIDIVACCHWWLS